MKSNLKCLITVVITLLTFTKLDAQLIISGMEGEVTTSSVKIAGIPNSFVNAINGKNIGGYEAGLFLKLGLGALYVKPKFLISHQSGTVQAVYPDLREEDVSFDITKLDIPVLAGLNVLGPLSVEAGPVYNRILTATKDFNGNSIDLRPGGLGYRIGVNAELGVLGLNAAYQSIKNNSFDTNFSSFSTPDELIFGASLSFGK